MNGRGSAPCALATGLVLALSSASAPLAQSWPQRPVKFIVSLAPGSGADIGARLLADRLAARWGHPVVVENRPGGDAVIAITTVIGARDDHTLLYTPASSFAVHPYLHDKMPYDPRELEPIARISNTLVGFGVPASLNVASLGDLITMVRAQPGKLNYSTATGMTDIIFEGYVQSAGLQITRVPYRDVVAPLTDLGEARIHAYMGALAIVQPHVHSGRVKLIAITNGMRAPTYPDVPTVAQAGFPELTFDGLVGLFGPKGLAVALRERIAADIRAVVTDPAVAARLDATAQLASPGTPDEFAASIEEQRAKLAALAQQLGIKPAQ
jgi:tripartite-type tricarboxylate transporter receptor subunit TctC